MLLLSKTFKQYMIVDLQIYNNCYCFQRRWKSKYIEVFRIILLIQVLQTNVMSFEIKRFRVLKSLLDFGHIQTFILLNYPNKGFGPSNSNPYGPNNEPLSHVHTNISRYKILTLIYPSLIIIFFFRKQYYLLEHIQLSHMTYGFMEEVVEYIA